MPPTVSQRRLDKVIDLAAEKFRAATGGDKATTLHDCIQHHGDADDMEELVGKGADVDEVDDEGFTPLSWACALGHDEIVQALLSAGADVSKASGAGVTPLHLACRQGFHLLARTLIKAEANIDAEDADGQTPAFYGCFKGHEKVVQYLLGKRSDVTHITRLGETLLHATSKGGNHKLVAFLIQRGVPVDTCDALGNTALHYAAELGNHRAGSVLMSRTIGKANVNVANKLPLHFACKNEKEVAAGYLVAKGGAGAQLDAQDELGWTPQGLCNDEMAKVLIGISDGSVDANKYLNPPKKEGARKKPEAEAAPASSSSVEQAAPGPSVNPQWQGCGVAQQMGGWGQQQQWMLPPVSLPGTPTNPQGPMWFPPPAGGLMPQTQPVATSPVTAHEQPKIEEDRPSEGGPQTAGDFEIQFSELECEKLIGKGGYGEVYRGVWLGTEVAIKKLLVTRMKPKDVEEFRGEVMTLSKLRHPNVVLFMGACTIAPNYAIVTEFLDRGSLFHVLRDRKLEYSWELMVKFAIGIARGMNYLHKSRPAILHRDLKSLNVLVDENLNVKVCDFGFTRVKATANVMTRVGTPQWMAPEVLRNEMYDEKCDVFSYGCVLWELYTRKDPHKGMNPMEVGRRVAMEGLRLKVPASCPDVLKDLIKDCFYDNPKQRPDFTDILKRLKDF